ncbi:endospore germination permease [Thalassobacillus sp. CUG 92003]|uniref:GerAB/ArcD/ProY family transporter n=1 Tax=Thalassobacillus sp. CUG 92003 TaxID=2736641 RepID=UPI0015E76901|nr:endospore germination permease [Thalassobacillus sp. CUG 92003]
MGNHTISPRQFMYLVILFTVGSSILIIPTPTAAMAKQDAWLSVLLPVSAGTLIIWFLSTFGRQLENKTFVEAAIFAFGNWFGRLLSFFYLSFIFILGALVLRNIGDFMTTQIMPDTPLQFTHILFLLVVIFGARQGLEVIGRSSEIFIPWIFLLLFFLFFSISPQINLDNLQPILGGGIKPILSSSLTYLGTPLLEMVIFLMVFPYVKEKKKAGRAWILGALIGGLILTLVTLFSVLVMGSDLTALNAYPSYELAKKINLAGFLEGVEIIVAIIWMLTIFFKLVIIYFACSLGTANFLNMEDYRPLLLPTGMGMVVLSIVAYPDVAYFEAFLGETWFLYALTHGMLLPLIIWAGFMIKRAHTESS